MIAAKKFPTGSRRGDWATPRALFRELERRYGRGKFTLDAAAAPWNAKCAQFYTEDDDALLQPWPGRVFVNPPYDNIRPWVRKAYCEVSFRRAEVVVMLLPARADQAWYHQAHDHGTIIPIRGRVSFEPPRGVIPTTPFEASVVVVFEQPLEAP